MTALSSAWRAWKSAKGVALLAIVAFAIGIGSATAIFTVINGVMLRPLPYPDGDRFVALYSAETTEPGRYGSLSVPDLIDYEKATTSFDVFGWFRLANFNLTVSGDPQYVNGAAVTPSLVQNLGVNPILGQWFSSQDGAVISYALWRRLGADPNIVGTSLRLDDRQFTVTGVMPSAFRLPATVVVDEGSRPDVWIYLDPRAEDRGFNAYFAYARRKPGVSLAQAQTDAKRVAADIARRDPVSHDSYTAEVVDLRTHSFTNLRPTLLLLLGGAGLLLLIACANVATLLLARSVTRARETAVRLALGATRRDLAFRYLAEALFVASLGAAAGFALSAVLVRVILAGSSEYVPNAGEIAIDTRVVVFGLAVALVTSALASLAPLGQAIRTPPIAALNEGIRGSAGVRARRLSQGLVVVETALAFTLLALSLTLVAHLRNLSRVPTGLDPNGVMSFELTAPQGTSDQLVPYQRRLIEAIQLTPGVTAAGLANQLPLDGCCMGGRAYSEDGHERGQSRDVAFVFVTPDYFPAMGIQLRAGRFLTEADTSDAFLFTVINETTANRYWPDRNPIGAFGRLNQPDGDRFQVVGVVRDVRNDGLGRVPRAELYLLATIAPIVNPMQVVVRSSLPPQQLIPGIRRVIQAVDRTLAMHNVQTMNQIVINSLQLERLSSLIMGLFAVAALVMAALGTYGVVAYAVRQRTVEMGTRMALGAVGRELLLLVIGGALRTVTAGIALGVVAVGFGVWLLSRVLEVRDASWLPLLSSTGVVVAVAAVASYVPAWRASLLSPMAAIRDESASAWQSIRRRFARAVGDVRKAVASGQASEPPPTLLTEFVAAARAADSFDEALQGALATLSRRSGVESAVLLEKHADGSFRRRVAIGSLERVDWNVPSDGFLANRLAAYPMPLPFERDELAALTEWAAANRPERLDEISTLARLDIRTVVPMRTRTEVMGILLLGPPGDDQLPGPADRHVLRSCADQFALMMENARLTARVVGQEALRRDLALAAEVQKRLLPSSPPSADIAEFAAISVPARSIGGDYYDFIQVGDQRIGIALADVSGKGVAAALIMSVVQASLRIIASDNDISLPRLAARMNEFLYRTTPGNKYATFFYAQVDGDRRQLRYVNAGHNPPYLVRAGQRPSEGTDGDSSLQELTIGGAVVGMLPGMSYEEATIDLCPGDVLLLYTDGVTEAHSPDSEEFGEDRLKALLREVAHLPAENIRERISAELREWIKDAEQYDDLTFVVMKVH